MKKALVLMLGLVASTASFATESTPKTAAAQTHLVMTADRKIRLYVQPLPTRGQVVIKDVAGQAVYTQPVTLHKGLRQQFDVSNLGTGTYQLTITTGTEIISRRFVMQASPNASFVVQ